MTTTTLETADCTTSGREEELQSLWEKVQQLDEEATTQNSVKEEEDNNNNVITIINNNHVESVIVPTLRCYYSSQDKELTNKQEHENEPDEEERENEQDEKHGKVLTTNFVSVTKALVCLVHFTSRASSSSSSRDDKSLVVSSGALDSTLKILQQLLQQCHQHYQQDDDLTYDQQQQQQRIQQLASLCVKILSQLATDASDVLKNDHLLPAVPTVHEVMKHYLTTTVSSKDNNNNNGQCVEIQRYGCIFLRQLSNPLLQELAAAGSLNVIVSAMNHHPEDAGVQENGNATMYNLLPLIPSSRSSPLNGCSLSSSSSPQSSPGMKDDPVLTSPSMSSSSSSSSLLLMADLPSIVIRGLEHHPTNLPVQQYGILVLKRLCQNDGGNYEEIIARGGLSVIIRSLAVPTISSGGSSLSNTDGNDHDNDENDDEQQEQQQQSQECLSPDELNDRECLAQLAVQFLQDVSRLSNYSDMDMLRAIAAKGGMDATLDLLRPDESNPFRLSVNIQDPAMAVLRNLCIHPDNRFELVSSSSSSSNGRGPHDNVVPYVLSVMERFFDDSAIQAYGCDVLGRLVLAKSSMEKEEAEEDTCDGDDGDTNKDRSNDDEQESSSIIVGATKALKAHRHHAGVQDRAIFVLLSLCSRQRGEKSIECFFSQNDDGQTREDMIEFLRSSTVPPKGVERLRVLIEILEKYLGISGGKQRPQSSSPGKENNVGFTGWRKATSWMSRMNSSNTATGTTASNLNNVHNASSGDDDNVDGTSAKPTSAGTQDPTSSNDGNIRRTGLGLSWRSRPSISSSSTLSSS